MGKEGFFSLSHIKTWFTRLHIHFNPPALQMVRVRAHRK